MRVLSHILQVTVAAAAFLILTSFLWAKPDVDFTRVAEQWLKSYVTTVLDETVKETKRAPTNSEVTAAWCKAIAAWKTANPGGEKKLTLESLSRMRLFELRCGQTRHIKLGIDARGLPEQTAVPLAGSLYDEEQEALTKAIRDFIAWHPDEFGDGATAEEYARKQLLVYWYSDEDDDLYRKYEDAVRRRDYHDADLWGAAIKRREEQIVAEAKLHWLRNHPDKPGEAVTTGGSEKRKYTRTDGATVTEYDNGVTGIDYPDGREETILPNGNREVRHPDGTLEIFYPWGDIEIVQGIGAARRTTIVHPDGSRDVFVGQNGEEYVGGYIPGLGEVRVTGGSHPAAGAPVDGGALRNRLAEAVKEAEQRKGSPLTELEKWEARNGALKDWEHQHPEGSRTGAQEAERRTEAARLRERQAEMEARRRIKSREDGTVDPLDRPGWIAARNKGRDIANGSVDPLDRQKPADAPTPPTTADGRDIDLGQRQTGQAYPFAFEARNATCSEPQDFRFESSGSTWLQFPQGTVLRGIAKGQTRQLNAQLNFSVTPPGVQTASVEVICETCGWFIFKSCYIDKQVLRLKVAVTPRK